LWKSQFREKLPPSPPPLLFLATPTAFLRSLSASREVAVEENRFSAFGYHYIQIYIICVYIFGRLFGERGGMVSGEEGESVARAVNSG